MGLALTFVLCSFVSVSLYWFWKHLCLRRALANIPQPRSFPLIGHALIVKPDVDGFVDQVMGMASLYPNSPRMVVFWNAVLPLVMIYEASIAEKVFTNSANLNKGFLYGMLKPWLGEGLLLSHPHVWKPRRKLLTPTFHYDILKNFIHVFNHQSEVMVNLLRDKFKDDTNESIEIPDISKPISLCALDIICETSMGQSIQAQLNTESEYVRAVLRINDIIQNRQKNPLVYPDFMFNLVGEGREHQWALNTLHSFTRKVIQERRKARAADMCTPNERPAFLDLLLELEDQGLIDEKSIQEEVDTFMFEGHDTTATASVWALHLFGCYPEVQQKVYDEIQKVIGDSTEITPDHISQLKYLECCLKEVLRLYPSVPFVTRRLGAPIQVGELVVPADIEVMINIYLIHRDPQYWDDPEVFRPERFLLENSVKRHPFAYVPFSAGSRNCIGQRFAMMEDKVMMIWFLRTFEVTSVKRRDEQQHKVELILRANPGMPIRLRRRTEHL